MPTPTAIMLRAATIEDAEAIWNVRVTALRRGGRDHYPREVLQQWLAAPMPQGFEQRLVDEPFIVAEQAGHIVGFAGLHRERREVDAVFVDPRHMGHRIGVRLLTALESAAKDFGIERLSLKASLNAVGFYAAAGYRATGDGWHVTPGGVQIACIHLQKALAGASSL